MEIILKERKKDEEDHDAWTRRCEGLIKEKCKYDEAVFNLVRGLSFFKKGILIATLTKNELIIWEDEL